MFEFPILKWPHPKYFLFGLQVQNVRNFFSSFPLLPPCSYDKKIRFTDCKSPFSIISIIHTWEKITIKETFLAPLYNSTIDQTSAGFRGGVRLEGDALGGGRAPHLPLQSGEWKGGLHSTLKPASLAPGKRTYNTANLPSVILKSNRLFYA